jgi:S1-C subfamily serine protease
MGDQATNRPWIGVYYVELDPATARDLNAPIDHGALIQKPEESDQPAVQPGSPAAFAGLREDDIVVAMDGQQIDATHSLRDLVLAHKPGDIARLEIQRNGQAFTVSVTLGTRPAGQ